MKLTTGILFLGMVAGTAWGQNPDVIENTRNTMKAVQQKKAMDSDAALSASQGSAANPATPSANQQPAAKQPVSKRVSSKPVALKAKSSAGHKKAQPKQEIAVENQKKPADTKSAAEADQPGRTARSVCQPGRQSQHAGFGMQFRQALPDHRPDQP